MLESLLASVLNRFLGVYVKNFDPKKLNVGIWGGNVELPSLELRREALDQFHLPLNVVGGHIEKLTLQIPWTNLRGEPLKIIIEDVFLLAVPRADGNYNTKEEEEREHKVKMDKLTNAELLKDRMDMDDLSKEDQQKKQSFTTSLVTAVVDNVQVQVKNIHIRYEDSISDPGHPFALGFTLETFEAASTDANWLPTFIQSSADQLAHKLGILESLAVYWDTNATLLGPGSSSNTELPVEDYVEKMRSMIARSGDEASLGSHQYLLKPVTGRAGFEINRTGRTDQPTMSSHLQFDELGFVMDDTQYRDALMLVDLFHYYIRRQEYRKFEPSESVMENPKAWFKFAGQMVLRRIHERNRKWTWDYIRERRDHRQRYLILFKKQKLEHTMTPEETIEVDELERKYDYQDLRFWRSLARSQLRKEKVKVQKAPPKQTWVQWMWGAGDGPKSGEDTVIEENEDSAEISEKERKQLYDAISWDENKMLADSVDVPEEYVKYAVDLTLDRGSLTLKQDPHGSQTNIVQLFFDSFRTKAFVRRSSIFADLTLEAMRLFDGSTPGTRFPQLIFIKGTPTEIVSFKPADVEEKVGATSRENRLRFHAAALRRTIDQVKAKDGIVMTESHDAQAVRTSEDSFFRLTFEHNPLDHSADNSLLVKLKAMEIIYNPQFLVAIVKFFRPPEMHMDSIGVLMESAGEAVEGIRRQTRAGLEFALEEHKTLNLTLDLQAPLIIVPDSVTEDSSLCLIIDAGHIGMQSVLADKDALKELQNKNPNQQYSQEDQKQLENLMYDKFLLNLSSTQVVLGTSIEDTRLGLEHPERRLHVIDRINIELELEMCIVPKTTNLTKFRVKGKLPNLHVNMSDTKYRSLMKLIDFAIPEFDEEVEFDNHGRPKSAVPHQSTLKRGNILSRPRGLSFSLSEIPLLVPDDDDSSIHDGSDSDHGSTSPVRQIEGRRKKSKKVTDWTQRTFEFTFTVSKLQGSVYRNDELLVNFVAENFFFNFFSRPYDFDATVRLQRFYVEDHVEKNPIPGLTNIVTSASLSGEDQDLLSVHVVRVNPASPDFVQKHEGVGINVDVEISTINVIVSRTTLLTLLDFVLITFTDDDSKQNSTTIPTLTLQQQGQAINDGQQPSALALPAAPLQTDRIRVKVELKKMAFILNNDGVQLATLSLESASVLVRLKDKTLAVDAQLGDLQLVDDVNLSVPASSPLRRLMSIKGNKTTSFHYETFDPNSPTFPGHDLSVSLQTCITVNFLVEPFHSILEFVVKFGKMQALFNAAREAAQRVQEIQKSSNRIKFEFLFDNPTVVFPRESGSLTANLGKVHLYNEFKPDTNGKVVNEISAELKNSCFQTSFVYPAAGSKTEILDLLDGADIHFTATVSDQQGRQQIEITGHMSDTQAHFTQEQIRFVTKLARDLPQVFEIKDDITDEAQDRSVVPYSQVNSQVTSAQGGNIAPTPSSQNGGMSIALFFSVGLLGLELISVPHMSPVGKRPPFAYFGLNGLSITFNQNAESVIRSEIKVESFDIRDCRVMAEHQTKKVQQKFGSVFDISKPNSKGSRRIDAEISIHQPRIILSLDFVLGLRSFLDAATEGPAVVSPPDSSAITQNTNSTKDLAQVHSNPAISDNIICVSITMVDSRIVLLANPSLASTEAIVLETRRISLIKHDVVNLSIEKVGMFLCRMDRIETTRLRILDDFDLILSVLTRTLGGDSYETAVRAEVGPLVVRVSLRDIMMVMQIINKAQERTEREGINPPHQNEAQKPISKSSSLALPAPSTPGPQRRSFRKAAARTLTPSVRPSSALIQIEEFSANIQPVRLVIIGDNHALPMLDVRLEEFNIDAKNWSHEFFVSAPLNLAVNVYNFSKSAWEPLIEPWQAQIQAEREAVGLPMSIELKSSVRLETTITASMISTAVESAGLLSLNEDVLSKPRENTAPYRIRNLTGLDIYVWGVSDVSLSQTHNHGRVQGPNDSIGTDTSDSSAAATILNGQEVPWRFEDPRMTRDTLNPKWATGSLGVKLQGSDFTTLPHIPVQQEGETVYNLTPKQDGIMYRMVVEVRLDKKNVKVITFRSPFQIHNGSDTLLELGVATRIPGTGDTANQWSVQTHRIEPGERFSIGVLDAYKSGFVIRPEGWRWSRLIKWNGENRKGLFDRPTRTVECMSENGNDRFRWHVHAVFDRANPLTKEPYPYMTVNILPPVQLQNLLPVEAVFELYTDDILAWRGTVSSGATLPIYTVSAHSNLKLSMKTKDQAIETVTFPQAETETKTDTVLIATREPETYRRDRELKMFDARGNVLRLELQYHEDEDSGGAFRVSVCAPYVVMNRTGQPVTIRCVGLANSKVRAAGGGNYQEGGLSVFNFPADNSKKRVFIQVPGSEWSKPTSFDTIGSANQVSLVREGSQGTRESTRAEFQLGVNVEEGDGQFRLVKVITLVPRFVIHNTLGRDILIRISQDTKIQKIPAGGILPLSFIRKTIVWKKDREGEHMKLELVMISLRLPDVDGVWSESIDIEHPNPQIKLRRGPDYFRIGFRVAVQGASQTLVISKPERSTDVDEIAKTGSQVEADIQSGAATETEKTLFQLSLAGIGLSLASSREILYATATDISATVNDSKTDIGLSLSINQLQIDNQLQGALQPIILSAVSIDKDDAKKAVFDATIAKSKRSTPNLTIVSCCSILLQRLALDLDEDFAFALLDFFRDANLWATTKPENDGLQVLGNSRTIPVAAPTPTTGSDFLFQHLLVQPVSVDFSFSRSQRLNSKDAGSYASGNPIMFLLNIMSFSIASINNAPLQYNALLLNNAHLSFPSLMAAVQSHYVQESLNQVHYVLGSADILGNPVGLFNHLTSGIADIFYEPYLGMVTADHPRDFGAGIAKGASSFAQKSTFALSDSVARFTRSLSNGIAVATRDRDFQTKRQVSRAAQPTHALQGLQFGGNALVSGFVQGFQGLGRLPIEGAESDGLTGLFKGVGKGVLGAFTKPAIGALDMASNVATGVRNTTTMFNPQTVARVRPPRFIPRGGVASPYDQNKAQGQLWLKQSDNGSNFEQEYLGHFLIPPGGSNMTTASADSSRLCIVTYTSLIMLHNTESLKKDWTCQLSDMMRITKERYGIAIFLWGDIAGPFLPISNPDSRDQAYKCISIAVKAWNNRWNIV